MTDRPTLHLTNWSSRRLHGPGRKWTIMAAARGRMRGDGAVSCFVPPLQLLREVQAGRMTEDAYATKLWAVAEAEWAALPGWGSPFAPDVLLAYESAGYAVYVRDGDSLLCACARAKAAAGRCHRATAAPFLVRAGWRVLLDGVEVTT